MEKFHIQWFHKYLFKDCWVPYCRDTAGNQRGQVVPVLAISNYNKMGRFANICLYPLLIAFIQSCLPKKGKTSQSDHT